MDPKSHLATLYARHAAETEGHAWPTEAGRWVELVFCVLLQCEGATSDGARAAVSILDRLALLSPAALGTMLEDSAEQVTFKHVLSSVGFDAGQAARALAALSALAQAVNAKRGGKIQKLVRRHAEELRDALVLDMGATPLTETQKRQAATHWLQNAFNLPLSLENEAAEAFCREHGLSTAALVEAIDDLDLNLALVDDLLTADRQTAKDADE